MEFLQSLPLLPYSGLGALIRCNSDYTEIFVGGVQKAESGGICVRAVHLHNSLHSPVRDSRLVIDSREVTHQRRIVGSGVLSSSQGEL